MTLSERVCRVYEDCEDCYGHLDTAVHKAAVNKAREQYFLNKGAVMSGPETTPRAPRVTEGGTSQRESRAMPVTRPAVKDLPKPKPTLLPRKASENKSELDKRDATPSVAAQIQKELEDTQRELAETKENLKKKAHHEKRADAIEATRQGRDRRRREDSEPEGAPKAKARS